MKKCILLNKRVVILFFLLFLLTHIKAQQYTISGYVTDSINGETLIGSNIYESRQQKGAIVNSHGFYSLTLPKGEVNIRYSYVGYSPKNIKFILFKDTIINIKLLPSGELKEIVVIGEREDNIVNNSQMSAVEIPIAQIKSIPMFLGEVDVIKALQLLPGVNSGTEGSASLYVRGGGPDENLLLLDGIPVYNVNHALGFFSIFNADAVKNVTLYKGSFPARFGGRLSSVVDVQMKDGDDKRFHANVNIGLISTKVNFEGPIIKERTTFNISARRTYLDVLSKPIILAAQNEGEKLSAGYYFYDLNAKLTHKFSEKDRLFLSAYMGDDVIYLDAEEEWSFSDASKGISKSSMGWSWGNLILALRWNHIINNKLFMNTTVSFTRYRSSLSSKNESEYIYTNPQSRWKDSYSMEYKSGIEDYSAKMDFDYFPNSNHNIKFGGSYIYHTFRPGVNVLKQNGDNSDITVIDTTIGDRNVYANETMLYIEDDAKINRFLKANVGIHYSTFSVQDKFYQSLQPRVSIRVLINNKLSFKAGYAMMAQYIHLLSNNTINLPTDLWVPATKRIDPMRSNQVAAGFFYILKNIADFSVEGYYKWMNNLIEYKDGASFMGSSTGWEEKVNMGKGHAYGIEFLAQRSFGKTTGWIGYTWSKTNRLFDRPGEELNNGKVFPAKYDRRHDISITASHKFNDRFDLSLTWVYSTGNALTLALQNYQRMPIPDFSEGYDYISDESSIPYINSRNNYRYNAYHRLDIGMNFRKKLKHSERIWNISIYNVYNRLNPFYIYVNEREKYDPSTNTYQAEKKLKQVSLFPIIPSVSLTYKF